MTNSHKAALYYSKNLHWSVIPVKLTRNGSKIEKKPLIIWGGFQNRIASEEEINSWFIQWPTAQVGVVTGKISNLLVLDVDKGGDVSGFDLPKTVEETTISGGKHYFFRFPEEEIHNSAGLLGKNLDIRGEGGFVVVAPSQYEKMTYNWVVKPVGNILYQIPEKLSLKLKISRNSDNYLKLNEIVNGVTEGNRNQTAASLVGKLVLKVKQPEDWDLLIWPTLKDWNQRNTPPLGEKELRTIFESICNIESRRLRGELVEDDEIITSHELYEKLKNLPEIKRFTTQSLESFDNIIGGFGEGNLIVVSGHSGEGKTEFLVYLTKEFEKQKVHCGWFNFEVDEKEFLERFGNELSNIPIFFLPSILKNNSLQRIEKQVKNMLEKGKEIGKEVKIIMFDHLHHFVGYQNMNQHLAGNLSAHLGMITIELKRIAKENKLIIFTVAHPGKEDILQPLTLNEVGRDSSFIIQNADTVLSIFRKKNLKTREYENNKVLLSILKNRYKGRIKNIILDFQDGKYFEENKEEKPNWSD